LPPEFVAAPFKVAVVLVRLLAALVETVGAAAKTLADKDNRNTSDDSPIKTAVNRLTG
jgi:hypothetical protein